VVFHQTVTTAAKQVAGVDSSVPDLMQGVQLALRGYVVLCPRCYIFAEGAGYSNHVHSMLAKHPSWKGMTRMLWDGVRAADYLESLSYVDKTRLGCVGHSLGAKEALYAAAFDERFQAAVFSEGGIGIGFSNWEAIWYLSGAVKQPDFALEHHQLMALIAPRAFLLLGGESADGDKSWPFIEAALPVYKLLGAPGELGWLNHRTGHRYPPEARAVAEEFIDRRLRP
jgi:pimeloyl-ACP methyl ester carboxylesterase